jgi:DNA-binding CsgD family transcriptional regulator
MTVTAPVDVVAKLSTTLAIHHAPHLLPGVLACLAPQLQPRPSEGGGRVCDMAGVVGLVSLLTADGRPDLITRVLLAVSPWLPTTAGAVIPPAPSRTPAETGLTVRQTEMLHLASYGMSNGEIGRKLFLAEDTVKTHMRRAYAALGALDRAHAVRLALECGALNSDTD